MPGMLDAASFALVATRCADGVRRAVIAGWFQLPALMSMLMLDFTACRNTSRAEADDRCTDDIPCRHMRATLHDLAP